MLLSIAGFLAASVSAQALQAPYLTRVSALSPDAVELTWRNNSLDYRGFIVFRKGAATETFGALDTLETVVERYVDTLVQPGRTFHYAVAAYGPDGSRSDTSNSDSITLAPVRFSQPRVTTTLDSATARLTLRFRDSSKFEKGFRIRRSIEYSPYVTAFEVSSPNPREMGREWEWSEGIAANAWHEYVVEIFGDSLVASSETFRFYLLRAAEIKPESDRELVLGNLIGEAPVQDQRWAIRSGDTVILSEANSPPDHYSAVDITDPKTPTFIGFTKTHALLANTPGDGRKNKVCVWTNGPITGTVACFAYLNGSFQGGKVVGVSSGKRYYSQWANDSIIVAEYSSGGVYGYSNLHGFKVLDTTAVGIGLFPVQGRYSGTTKYYGWADDRLYAEIISKKGVTEPGFSVLRMFDVRSPNGEIRAADVGENRPILNLPKVIEGLAVLDSALLAARHLLIDTVKQQVVVLTPDRLRIHAYSTRPLAHTVGARRVSASGPRQSDGLIIRKSRSGLQIALESGRPMEEAKVHRLDGTPIAPPYVRRDGNWIHHPLPPSGIYVIRVRRGSESFARLLPLP